MTNPKEVMVAFQTHVAQAKMPTYATEGSAGADLYASGYDVIQPNETLLVGTGVSIELPEGYEAQVRSRSGLAAKFSVHVLNAPGTIDSDYRGEIKVILRNSGIEPFGIQPGDRIAQLVVSPVCKALFFAAGGALNMTKRGSGGFGSTGV
ncbi:MAG: dUTP diphosphatase [Undibacterium sp.]